MHRLRKIQPEGRRSIQLRAGLSKGTKMKNFNNKVAAITGAGSGIGQQLAVLLAQQGCQLFVIDLHVASRVGVPHLRHLCKKSAKSLDDSTS